MCQTHACAASHIVSGANPEYDAAFGALLRIAKRPGDDSSRRLPGRPSMALGHVSPAVAHSLDCPDVDAQGWYDACLHTDRQPDTKENKTNRVAAENSGPFAPKVPWTTE
ncbi:hypothetical protein G7Z17_g13741 [Cylindrodendrum hubeiense]|uniref:Uncharacterized protein n=1 Tax=Cylindrodendrum hubeiense TaxID=595255 RepID=A0A9P5GWH8_9HYPO|nr:hypothetical protein G7Z17_g13741 [Cylindrodendrum hubeiense]